MEPAMTHPYLLAAGGLLIVCGLLLLRWASRHDLKGLAIDTAWEVAKNRGRVDVETEFGNRLKDLRAESSNIGRAKMVAGHAARHVAAQVATIAGLIALAGGAILVALALWWS
jgi:hypothetical protein